MPTAFLTKRSEQSWSEVYKKCIFDQKFWAKIPWSEAYKNCVYDQIQGLEIIKIFYHYCSLKMLCQIIKLHLEQSGTWISCHFGRGLDISTPDNSTPDISTPYKSRLRLLQRMKFNLLFARALGVESYYLHYVFKLFTHNL